MTSTDTSLEITMIGGNCPVQAEGVLDGEPFYFRARGNRWSMGVGGTDPVTSPAWSYEAPYGAEPFEAGWMDVAEARAFIALAAARYRASKERPA